MFTEHASKPEEGFWGKPLDLDPCCEVCERSMINRFGGSPSQFCESCAADFKLECDASGGSMEADE